MLITPTVVYGYKRVCTAEHVLFLTKYDSQRPLHPEIKVLKALLLQCYHYPINFADAIASEGVQPLQDILTSLGGWPMIEASWSDASFDLAAFMANVARLKGVILHDFSVANEPNDNSKFLFYVSCTLIPFRFAMKICSIWISPKVKKQVSDINSSQTMNHRCYMLKQVINKTASFQKEAMRTLVAL